MIWLIIFDALCLIGIGFCVGSLHTLTTSTQAAMNGWRDCLSAYEDAYRVL